MESLRGPPQTLEFLTSEFQLLPVFDYGAVFFFALTGALAAFRRRYDLVGLFAMAFLTGLGGALIRDGLFLQNGPPALIRDRNYLIAVLAACAVGWVAGGVLEKFQKLIAVLDAIGLGTYSVVGVQKSMAAGLNAPAAILVGVTNACGGGLLRDIITRDEPLMMKPGQFYVMASFLGSCLFVSLATHHEWSANFSALIAIGTTFGFRVLAIVFNWRTRALRPWLSDADANHRKDDPVKSEPPAKSDDPR